MSLGTALLVALCAAPEPKPGSRSSRPPAVEQTPSLRLCDDVVDSSAPSNAFTPVTPQHTREQQQRVATELVLVRPVRDSTSKSKKIASDLGHEELRQIDPTRLHATKERGIPMEHAPRTTADLCRERREILSFLSKQLKQDPRAKPEEYQVVTDHLNSCVGCKNTEAARAALHDDELRIIGNEVQWLVDDYMISSWRNAMRFLNPPAEQKALLKPPPRDESTRFGCPCSAVSAPDGGVYLWHAGKLKNGTLVPHPRRPGGTAFPTLDEHVMLMRHSPDGVANWSKPEQIDLRQGGTGKVSSTHVFRQFSVGVQPLADASALGANNKHLRNASQLFMAGYEGGGAQACLAVSADGVLWRPLGAQPNRDDGTHTFKERICPGVGVAWAQRSFFGRAADSSVVPVFDAKLRRDMLWHRKDFGTPHGWREIRGVQVQTLNRRFGDLGSVREKNVSRKVLASWYLDRLGKMERFRRQIYSLSLAPHGRDLWIGLMTVVEWAKDTTAEPVGDDQRAFERDTTQIYFVTSRDGVHVDDGWVYAHRPLIAKGAKQGEWDSGLLLPAPQIVSDARGHLVYFEARNTHHETRFKAQATIGVSRWERHRIVGLRQAHTATSAVVVTKIFLIDGWRLYLDVDSGADGSAGHITVEVYTPNEKVIGGFEATASELKPAEGGDRAVEVQWQGKSLGHAREKVMRAAKERGVRKPVPGIFLRFVLRGGSRLYTFQVRPDPQADPEANPLSAPASSGGPAWLNE